MMITAFLPLLKHPCFPRASRFQKNAPLRVASAEASPTPLPTGCIYSLKAGNKIDPMESTKKIKGSTTNSTRNHFVRRKGPMWYLWCFFLVNFRWDVHPKRRKPWGEASKFHTPGKGTANVVEDLLLILNNSTSCKIK